MTFEALFSLQSQQPENTSSEGERYMESFEKRGGLDLLEML